MSMLGEQASNLRLTADAITAHGVTSGDIAIIAIRLREAADTIEGLRDRMHLVPAELDYIEDKSRWHELFGTPERAARTLANNCHRDGCIACPALDADCNVGDYDKLLEWLRGDA
jgi:hypothetical protein